MIQLHLQGKQSPAPWSCAKLLRPQLDELLPNKFPADVTPVARQNLVQASFQAPSMQTGIGRYSLQPCGSEQVIDLQGVTTQLHHTAAPLAHFGVPAQAVSGQHEQQEQPHQQRLQQQQCQQQQQLEQQIRQQQQQQQQGEQYRDQDAIDVFLMHQRSPAGGRDAAKHKSVAASISVPSGKTAATTTVSERAETAGVSNTNNNLDPARCEDATSSDPHLHCGTAECGPEQAQHSAQQSVVTGSLLLSSSSVLALPADLSPAGADYARSAPPLSELAVACKDLASVAAAHAQQRAELQHLLQSQAAASATTTYAAQSPHHTASRLHKTSQRHSAAQSRHKSGVGSAPAGRGSKHYSVADTAAWPPGPLYKGRAAATRAVTPAGIRQQPELDASQQAAQALLGGAPAQGTVIVRQGCQEGCAADGDHAAVLSSEASVGSWLHGAGKQQAATSSGHQDGLQLSNATISRHQDGLQLSIAERPGTGTGHRSAAHVDSVQASSGGPGVYRFADTSSDTSNGVVAELSSGHTATSDPTPIGAAASARQCDDHTSKAATSTDLVSSLAGQNGHPEASTNFEPSFGTVHAMLLSLQLPATDAAAGLAEAATPVALPAPDLAAQPSGLNATALTVRDVPQTVPGTEGGFTTLFKPVPGDELSCMLHITLKRKTCFVANCAVQLLGECVCTCFAALFLAKVWSDCMYGSDITHSRCLTALGSPTKATALCLPYMHTCTPLLQPSLC